MKCPDCSGKTEVTHNRSFPEYVRRRRVCKQCGAVMTTYETLKPPGERYPMGRPKKKKKRAPKKAEAKIPCKFNAGVVCDGKKRCKNCGWNPNERS